jgi:hypothetical protein
VLSARLKIGFHFVGGALALVGVVFLYTRISSQAAEINLVIFNANTWSLVAIMSMVYGLSNVILAHAWQKVLQHLGVSVAAPWAISAYGISQIARYLPGNIFHIAGRQALGAAANLPHWPLAKSAVWELGLIAAAGTMFGLLILPLLTEYVTYATSLTLFIATLVVSLILLKHLHSQAIMLAFKLHLIFLLISGIIFTCLIELLSEDAAIQVKDWLPLIGTYIVAWLAGLVTPGSPAGIGIRELVLLLLLNGIIGETELVMVVALVRFVTASGDGLFFIASSVYGKRFFK